MRDYRGASDIADAAGDKAEIAKIQQDWKAQARIYLKRAHPDGGDGGGSKAKRFRVKSMEWGLQLRNGLMTVAGQWSDFFQIKLEWVGSDTVDPYDWPEPLG